MNEVPEFLRLPLLDAGSLPPAARTDLLRRLGRHSEAAVSYEMAPGPAGTEAERRYLARRHAEMSVASD